MPDPDRLEAARAQFLEGVRCQQTGDLDAAEAAYRKALEFAPDRPSVLYNLALLLMLTRRFAEATVLLKRKLQVEPDDAEALSNLGACLAEDGNPAEALQCFEQALRLSPDAVPVHGRMGHLLLALGRIEDARACFDRALAANPDDVAALHGRGVALAAGGHCEEALAAFERAVALDPENAGLLVSRGEALYDAGRLEEALASYERALAIDPASPDALYDRGNVLCDLRRFESALASYDQALAVRPEHPATLVNRGTALSDLGRFDEALGSYDRALAAKPDFSQALNNRGNALLDLRRPREALASYERSLALDPGNAEAHFNLCVCALMVGDFARGWDEYEWRWQTERLRGKGRRYDQPQWGGERVDGTLFVWGEQGLGDQILFAGLLDELRLRAGRVVVEIDSRLIDLFRRSFAGIEFVGAGEGPYAGPIDAQTPLASIGRHFRRSWSDFPAGRARYLESDPIRRERLRERLAGDGQRLIGLSWLSRNNPLSERKSAALTDFAPLLRMPGTRFVDLQYGETAADRAAARQSLGVDVLRVDDLDTLRDIDGWTALIDACDMVVTVSNTTAHIAGALGKPACVVLPYSQGTLWYWHADRDDSPWYPTVRVFRQPSFGDWRGAIEQVAGALDATTGR